MKTILWWGRFDPDYARNRILRNLQQELGYQIIDFQPRSGITATIEAKLKGIKKPDFVWVPCFRQRDVLTAARWARSQQIQLVFDPLISAWDKQVFERKKFNVESPQAYKLLMQERKQFQHADLVIADTEEHARFFSDTFHIDPDQIKVIPVGAEESLFKPANHPDNRPDITEVLFYGSFINLQGPQTIIEVAQLCEDKPIRWHLLGTGPLLAQCKEMAQGLKNIVFEEWIDYKQLPDRIHQADILLGVFGSSEKAGRVIPNKLYQSIACARPVITRESAAYPTTLQDGLQSGIFQIPANDPQALKDQVVMLSNDRELIISSGINARKTYETYFSNTVIKKALESAFLSLGRF